MTLVGLNTARKIPCRLNFQKNTNPKLGLVQRDSVLYIAIIKKYESRVQASHFTSLQDPRTSHDESSGAQ
jgi:hypothetical protein